MIIVTGGAGFIGSNIVAALNAGGERDILVVDRRGENYSNLADLKFSEFLEPDKFRGAIERNALGGNIEAIYHQGACADTTATDRDFVMANNFEFSKAVLGFALERKIPMVYASSAAVYGASTSSEMVETNERPLNLYAESKLAFDNHVRRELARASSTVVGLRYFNVYGPRERYKGAMASMCYQLYCQLRESGEARLFEGTDGYADGEQRRDFVFVGDIVALNLHFGRAASITKGIFNAGTGASASFNDVARELITIVGKGTVKYVPIPEKLRGKYQSFTQADLSGLRAAGWTSEFTPIAEGLRSSAGMWERDG